MLQFSDMANETLLTPEGYEKLKKELEDLKGPTRLRIADAIREAKSHGDLKENAAYHEAKLNQSRLEGRIADLERVLEKARIVERPANAGDTAHLGSKVTLWDLKWEEQIEITLVGSYEADPALDMISIASPFGSAVLGRGTGDEIEFEAPAGAQRFRIDKVEVGE